jgi:hypothetical protein
MSLRRQTWVLLLSASVLVGVSLACSVGQALVGRSDGAAVATATKTPRPTFTPLPGLLTLPATAPASIRGDLPPGVTVMPPASQAITSTAGIPAGSAGLVLYATLTPTITPTPGPTAPPTPTPAATVDVETNRPTPISGPRPLPTPFVVVNVDGLVGHRGPAVTFPQVGQADQGTELMILGRTPANDWWQVCCLANQPVWVAASQVSANGPLETVPVLTPGPTPAPTAVPPPPPTPTVAPTPLPPFDIARGPEFPIQRDTGLLTIWVKIYEGSGAYEKPLPGYQLKVFRDDVDVSSAMQSHGNAFDEIAQFSGETKTVLYLYNLKFEMPGAAEADWQIYLARPDGSRVSPITKFNTKGDSYRNLVVFIAYWLAR